MNRYKRMAELEELLFFAEDKNDTNDNNLDYDLLNAEYKSLVAQEKEYTTLCDSVHDTIIDEVDTDDTTSLYEDNINTPRNYLTEK